MTRRRPHRALTPAQAGQDEASIQSRIVQYLETTGWHVEVSDKASMGRSRRKGAFRRGWPDVQAWKGDAYLLIETKTPNGRLSPEQREVHTRLGACGVQVHVPRDHEEIIALLAGRERRQEARSGAEGGWRP